MEGSGGTFGQAEPSQSVLDPGSTLPKLDPNSASRSPAAPTMSRTEQQEPQERGHVTVSDKPSSSVAPVFVSPGAARDQGRSHGGRGRSQGGRVTRVKGFSHWVTRGRFCTNVKNCTIGFNVKF